MRNLFGEGNDVFREGNWARSVELYTEALDVSEYAESEDIDVPCKTRERLHANRAAAYLHIVSAHFCHSGGCSVGGRAAVKDLTAKKKLFQTWTVMPQIHEIEIVFVQHVDLFIYFYFLWCCRVSMTKP